MTITSEEYFVEGEKWEAIESTALTVPADSWVKIKAFILKVCKQSEACSDKIGTWEKKIEKLEAVQR